MNRTCVSNIKPTTSNLIFMPTILRIPPYTSNYLLKCGSVVFGWIFWGLTTEPEEMGQEPFPRVLSQVTRMNSKKREADPMRSLDRETDLVDSPLPRPIPSRSSDLVTVAGHNEQITPRAPVPSPQVRWLDPPNIYRNHRTETEVSQEP